MRHLRLHLSALFLVSCLFTICSAARAAEAPAAPAELAKKWSYSYGKADRRLGAFLGKTTLYLATGETLFALDAATGKLKWKAKPGQIQSAPLEIGETVMVLTDAEHLTLISYQARTGKKGWTYETKDPAWADGYPMVASGTTVYFESQPGTLYAVDSKEGRLLWSKESSSEEEAGVFPIVQSGTVLWADGDLRGTDATTGKRSWRLARKEHTFATFGAVPGVAWFTRAESNKLTGVDLATGGDKWSLDVIDEPYLSRRASVAGTNLLICDDSNVGVIDLVSGEVAWVKELDPGPLAGTLHADTTSVYFLSSPSKEDLFQVALRALNIETGEPQWETPLPGASELPALQSGFLFASDGEKWLQVIDAKTGVVRGRAKYASVLTRDLLFGHDTLYLILNKEVVALTLPGLTPGASGGPIGPRKSSDN